MTKYIFSFKLGVHDIVETGAKIIMFWLRRFSSRAINRSKIASGVQGNLLAQSWWSHRQNCLKYIKIAITPILGIFALLKISKHWNKCKTLTLPESLSLKIVFLVQFCATMFESLDRCVGKLPPQKLCVMWSKIIFKLILMKEEQGGNNVMCSMMGFFFNLRVFIWIKEDPKAFFKYSVPTQSLSSHVTNYCTISLAKFNCRNKGTKSLISRR